MRMLCSRSASLMTSTRGSRAIATTILRIVSALAASPNLTLSSLVTPSTRWATSAPKSPLDVVERVAGVLDGVVQQRGDQRGGVHAQLGQDRRHRERVGDVRVAGLAQLAAVVLLRDVVRPLQDAQVGLRVRGPVGGDQRLEHRLDAGRALPAGGEPAGQPGPDPAPVGRGVRRVPGIAAVSMASGSSSSSSGRPGSGCVGYGSAANSASSLTSTSAAVTPRSPPSADAAGGPSARGRPSTAAVRPSAAAASAPVGRGGPAPSAQRRGHAVGRRRRGGGGRGRLGRGVAVGGRRGAVLGERGLVRARLIAGRPVLIGPGACRCRGEVGTQSRSLPSRT